MSAIDQYKHQFLTFVDCDSDYDFVPGSETRKIAIYELLQDIPQDEKDFDGKLGDILIGGGSGEAKALRISIPEIFYFKLNKDFDFEDLKEIYMSFWNPTFSFKIGNGFLRSGWNPNEIYLETWLVNFVFENILLKNEKYKKYLKKYRF